MVQNLVSVIKFLHIIELIILILNLYLNMNLMLSFIDTRSVQIKESDDISNY